MHSRIFIGQVLHGRKLPVEHIFTYPAYSVCVDLDELAALGGQSCLFGYNRFRLLSIYDRDYVHGGAGSIAEKIRAQLRERGCTEEITRIELVTMPLFLGYAFNPVSFYFCFDATGVVRYQIAEINNTYHQRHSYFFGGSDAPPIAGAHQEESQRVVKYSIKKAFFVSPFNFVEGEYDVSFADIRSRLDVRFNIRHGDTTTFVSRLWGEAKPFCAAQLGKLLWKFPLSILLTLPRIFWQAQRLRFQRQLPMLWVPKARSAKTIDL